MNTPQWLEAQQKVLAAFPSAKCIYNTDLGKFQIVLSEKWDTETMAWHEAANNVAKTDGRPA